MLIISETKLRGKMSQCAQERKQSTLINLQATNSIISTIEKNLNLMTLL